MYCVLARGGNIAARLPPLWCILVLGVDRYWHQHNTDDAKALSLGKGGGEEKKARDTARTLALTLECLGWEEALAPVAVDGRFVLPSLPASVLALAAEDEEDEDDEDEDEEDEGMIDFNDIAHLLAGREEEEREEEEGEEEEDEEEEREEEE